MDTEDAPVSPFQLLILFLSVFVLLSIIAQTFLPIPPELNRLLTELDTLICFVFIGDFAFRCWSARDKKAFLRWGWVDLASSIPTIEALRWGRVIRIVRLLRVLRAFRSTRVLLRCLYQGDRDRAAFSTVAIGAFLIAVFSSIAVVTFEEGTGSGLATAGDGLWWSFYTMANIDYMGRFPRSFEGMLIRLLLVVTGMVLLAILTGYAASYFLEDDQREQSGEIDALRREVELLLQALAPSVVEQRQHLPGAQDPQRTGEGPP